MSETKLHLYSFWPMREDTNWGEFRRCVLCGKVDKTGDDETGDQTEVCPHYLKEPLDRLINVAEVICDRDSGGTIEPLREALTAVKESK